MNSELKTNYRTLQRFLKFQSKDKYLLVRSELGWDVAIACKSKTKAGINYNRLARLVRKIRNARTQYV